MATVLSGCVSQRGDDLLINVELDDVRTGKQVWGQRYTRKVTELLQVQNEISREVSQKLRAQLSEADRQKMTIGSTTNPDAYRLYLKGSYYTDKFSKDGFDKGIDFLNQAIALDPEYAQASSPLLVVEPEAVVVAPCGPVMLPDSVVPVRVRVALPVPETVAPFALVAEPEAVTVFLLRDTELLAVPP